MPLQQLLSEELRYDKCTVLISPYLGYIISYIMHYLSGWLSNGYDEIFDWQSRLTVSSLSMHNLTYWLYENSLMLLIILSSSYSQVSS